MGNIQVFIADENGAGWKDVSKMTDDEWSELAVDIALAEMNMQEVQLLCVTCLAPIPSGTGSSYCDNHK